MSDFLSTLVARHLNPTGIGLRPRPVSLFGPAPRVELPPAPVAAADQAPAGERRAAPEGDLRLTPPETDWAGPPAADAEHPAIPASPGRPALRRNLRRPRPAARQASPGEQSGEVIEQAWGTPEPADQPAAPDSAPAAAASLQANPIGDDQVSQTEETPLPPAGPRTEQRQTAGMMPRAAQPPHRRVETQPPAPMRDQAAPDVARDAARPVAALPLHEHEEVPQPAPIAPATAPGSAHPAAGTARATQSASLASNLVPASATGALAATATETLIQPSPQGSASPGAGELMRRPTGLPATVVPPSRLPEPPALPRGPGPVLRADDAAPAPATAPDLERSRGRPASSPPAAAGPQALRPLAAPAEPREAPQQARAAPRTAATGQPESAKPASTQSAAEPPAARRVPPERVVVQAQVTPAAAPPAENERAVSSAAAEPATITVTIGRIEVRAMPPPAAPALKSKAPTPALKLEDYLRERASGGKR
jgi:hypothetical protein